MWFSHNSVWLNLIVCLIPKMKWKLMNIINVYPYIFFTAGSLFFLANDLHPRYIYKFSNHYRKSIISENVFCSMSTTFPAYTFLFESPSHKMKKRQMNLEQSSVSLNIWYSNFVFCWLRQSHIKQQTTQSSIS